jgi:Zn-dependent peptidase ImmA (M78 family)
MALRWGFKSEANSIAREIRAELALSSTAPLDPWLLATHLGISVVPLTELSTEAPLAAVRFLRLDKRAFSAVTVFRGHKRVIVINDTHHPRRQASDLAHELAHGLLLHEPTNTFDASGARLWNEDMEEEASWLAGALLISDEAALHIVRTGLSIREAARTYGVSAPMIQFRINMTGAKARIQRAEKYRIR